MDRRALLQQVTAVTAAAAASGLRPTRGEAQAAPDFIARHFPGFERSRVTTSGAEIQAIVGGSGPPLLLLHGAPQSLASWYLVAASLAEEYTVVATDLRGYGDSSTPPDGENHANYSKRAMALDQVEVMRHFGFDTFRLVGHDRGGRVGRRLALDHPAVVERLAVLDIVPAHYLYDNLTLEFTQAYFHWFLYLRPAPFPENVIRDQRAARAGRARSEIQAELARTADTPENIHAMCEDYRASASVDLARDREDQAAGRRITCPVLTLWGANGPMGRLYDVLEIWKTEGTQVSGRALPGGHNLQLDVPDEVLAELRRFL